MKIATRLLARVMPWLLAVGAVAYVNAASASHCVVYYIFGQAYTICY